LIRKKLCLFFDFEVMHGNWHPERRIFSQGIIQRL